MEKTQEERWAKTQEEIRQLREKIDTEEVKTYIRNFLYKRTLKHDENEYNCLRKKILKDDLYAIVVFMDMNGEMDEYRI